MNKKRNWVYLFCFIGMAVLIVWKQQSVNEERQQDIISTFSEWETTGKPVAVHTVLRRDVPFYTKVTAWQIGEHLFEGYVSKEVREKIQVGQEMLFYVDGDKVPGSIAKIADEISLETGMYRVQVDVPQLFDLKGWIVTYAHTDTLRDVICIPNEIIDSEGGKLFVWKAVNSKAVKQHITIGQRDGYGAVVAEGLQEGDGIIVKGTGILAEGDKVSILMDDSDEEIDHD